MRGRRWVESSSAGLVVVAEAAGTAAVADIVAEADIAAAGIGRTAPCRAAGTVARG